MRRHKIIDSIIDSGLILEGSYIIVGISGGPDSLCLLHSLAQIADSYDLTLIPVHVNHKLRAEADEEADNVARMCDKLGLDVESFEVNCEDVAREMKVSTEEAGRHIRYEIFDDVARDIEDQGVQREKIMIAVAHNADDQSETVLFRILRGTGVHGLAGIPVVRPSEAGYMIIRPLLFVPRADIEQYIKDNKLHPNMDATNEGTDYTRNKIRNELIPYLEKNYNPNIRQALRRFAMIAEMDDALLSDAAFSAADGHMIVDNDSRRVILDISDLRDNPPSIVSRVAGYILQSLRIEMNSSYELMSAIMNLIYSDNPSASLDLPDGFRAYREYDTVIFAGDDDEIRIKPDDSIRMFPQVLMRKDFHPDEDMMYAAFDFDLFNKEYPGRVGELQMRTRQEGDYIPMKRGRKKIQDLLVDSKVMKNARDSILMVAIDNEVLWILPSKYFKGRQEQEKGRFSPKYHITDATERVLLIEIAENI
ncbi:MAG: tRNA lysidine(34) synthetase TilS [Mogibacterium sp.]|nr:tRNA lysidine(34) synthetase TilS [Mogibacterium sp.]MBR2540747.1 tRNA lysidine(34) synthetase TilS [Mogibacterium sp.]